MSVYLNGFEIRCTADVECPGPLTCFNNASGPSAQYSYCACSNYFGWSGDNCTTFSAPTYGEISICCTSITVACIGIIWSGTWIHHLFNQHQAKTKRTIVTLMLAMTTFLFCLIRSSFEIAKVVSPHKFTHILRDGSKASEYYLPTVICFDLSIYFALLLCLHITYMWIELSLNIVESKFVSFMHHLKIFIILIAILFLGATISCIIVQEQVPFIVTALFSFFVIGVFFGAGTTNMSRLYGKILSIAHSDTERSRVSHQISKLRLLTFSVSVLSLVALTLGVYYGVLIWGSVDQDDAESHRESANGDEFNPVEVIALLIGLMVNLVAFTMFLYVVSNLSKSTVPGGSVTTARSENVEDNDSNCNEGNDCCAVKPDA